ncbi:hypothetical protein EVA_16581 [gut metagenome]|uniref:Uncharacterized protein n=1 Tax=gut metagenome TaxID=749906 RepID=J9G0I0_9ZZZZ
MTATKELTKNIFKAAKATTAKATKAATKATSWITESKFIILSFFSFIA